jgi:hypothetical protein
MAILAACALMAAPLVVILLATAVYALSVLAGLAGFPATAERLVGAYSASIGWLFNPPVLPTVVPRLVVLVLLALVGVLAAAWWQSRRSGTKRKARGAVLWSLLGHPLDAGEAERVAVENAWRLTPGGSAAVPPQRADVGRRFVEMMAENFGQPGFRELVIGVHDLDARRDVTVGVVAPQWQAAFQTRRVGAGPREAEAIELAQAGDADRGVLADALIGSLRVPAACEPHEMEWPLAGYWRGERHRWTDRPELVGRLIDEVARIGVEQVVLVSPAPPAALPHDLRARPRDFRARMGEAWRSIETAAFQDAWAAAASRFSGVFAIRPDHNAISPFDFTGGYDEGSDRTRTVQELMAQGYEDAYRQFIEPVVATGERIDS